MAALWWRTWPVHMCNAIGWLTLGRCTSLSACTCVHPRSIRPCTHILACTILSVQLGAHVYTFVFICPFTTNYLWVCTRVYAAYILCRYSRDAWSSNTIVCMRLYVARYTIELTDPELTCVQYLYNYVPVQHIFCEQRCAYCYSQQKTSNQSIMWVFVYVLIGISAESITELYYCISYR